MNTQPLYVLSNSEIEDCEHVNVLEHGKTLYSRKSTVGNLLPYNVVPFIKAHENHFKNIFPKVSKS